jgi:hypothetical protein
MSDKVIDCASKALEECTEISGMVCVLCKTGGKSVITAPGPPPSPTTESHRPRPVLLGSSPDLASPMVHLNSNDTVMTMTLEHPATEDTARM